MVVNKITTIAIAAAVVGILGQSPVSAYPQGYGMPGSTSTSNIPIAVPSPARPIAAPSPGVMAGNPIIPTPTPSTNPNGDYVDCPADCIKRKPFRCSREECDNKMKECNEQSMRDEYKLRLDSGTLRN